MAKLILFQGDSITDCGRSREYDDMTGNGYPTMVKGEIGYKYPGKYSFVNKGISGNRIIDVYARINSDIINLKPDYMSLLIGVNDVWHELGGRCNGISAEKYEKIYSMLIEEIMGALPKIKIMILNHLYYRQLQQRPQRRNLIVGISFIQKYLRERKAQNVLQKNII